MIFDARSVSRRWITVTLSANLVRKMRLLERRVAAADDGDLVAAEEEAVARGARRQAVADAAAVSASRPSISERAPVLTMTASASYTVSRTHTWNGRAERSTLVAFSVRNSAPKRSACWRKLPISSGPMIPSGKPGKFSTSVVSISWPPGWSLVLDGSPSMTRGARLARAA